MTTIINNVSVTDEENTAKQLYEKKAPFVFYEHDGLRAPDFAKYVITDLGETDDMFFEKVYQRYMNIPWTVAETKRCIIRETTEDDVDDFYEIYLAPGMTDYTEGLYEDKEEERKYISQYREKVYGFYGFGVWTIVDKESKRVIGRAGLSMREGFEDVELGYVIAKHMQNKGYAYEVCREILDIACKDLEFDKVNAFTLAENKASVLLLNKLNFKRVGEASINGVNHEHYVYFTCP